MSKIVHGFPLPLFERLFDEPPGEDATMLETLEGMQSSIQRELSRLLNTRSPLPLQDYLEHAHSVVDYGIPDFLCLDTHSGEEMAHFQQLLQIAIERFEPRLTNVQVQLQASTVQVGTTFVRIAADACIEASDRRMEFDIALDTDPRSQQAA